MARLNFLKACLYSLLFVTLTGLAVTINNENVSESIYGKYYAFYFHGDTLTFLDYGGHFGLNHIMSEGYSFKYKTSGDTVFCADSSNYLFNPITVYSPYSEIDYVSVYDCTPKQLYHLKLLNRPLITDKSLPKDQNSIIPDYYISKWVKTRKLDKFSSISNLDLYILGLQFDLSNYWTSTPYIADDIIKPEANMLVYYDLEQILKSLKFVLKGDSLEVLDWENNPIHVLKKNTSTFMSFYIEQEDGTTVLKQFNRESTKLNNYRIY